MTARYSLLASEGYIIVLVSTLLVDAQAPYYRAGIMVVCLVCPTTAAAAGPYRRGAPKKHRPDPPD